MLALSATAFEILMLKDRKWLNFPTPLLFEAPARGEPLWISKWNLAPENYNRVATRWYRNHDASFFRFDTIPACDRRTDRQRDTLLSQRPALA